MQWKYYAPIMIFGLILSSVSLALNIYKYKNNTKSRDGILAELGQLKNMTSQYLDALEWTTKDLRDRIIRLEANNRKLLQKIVYLTKDETFPELKSHPVKTIRIRQKQPELFFRLEWLLLYTLSLEIPAEDANLVLFNSPKPQAMPTPSIITRLNIIRKNQIPWQAKFRIDPTVVKIPFTDWALVVSHGLKKIRFCADAFLLLARVLPDPLSPVDIIVDKLRKAEIISIGKAPDHVEISIDIPDQNRLVRVSEFFLDAIIKIYPDIRKRFRPNRERLSNLPFYRYLQPAGKDPKERNGVSGPLITSIKIELETYKQAIVRLRTEAKSHENIPSPESLARGGLAHYKCSAHVRLQSIDWNGNAFFDVEK